MNKLISELAAQNDRIQSLYEIGAVHRCAVEDFADQVLAECIKKILNLQSNELSDEMSDYDRGYYAGINKSLASIVNLFEEK